MFIVGATYKGEHGNGNRTDTVTYKVLSIKENGEKALVEVLEEDTFGERYGVGAKLDFHLSGCTDDVLLKEDNVLKILKKIDEL